MFYISLNRIKIMPIFTKSVRVNSPLDDVWNFHSNIDGLEYLTPSWMNLKIESVVDSNGKKIKVGLPVGTAILASIHPFKIGQPVIWNVQILERNKQQTSAFFRDDVSGKPFQKWTHTHSFSTYGDCTILTDHVDYDLGGFLSSFSILCYPIFWIMFAMRQYQLKKVFRND